MAEAIGVAGAIVTLLQAGGIIAKGFTQWKNAPDEILQFQDEVADLNAVVSGIREVEAEALAGISDTVRLTNALKKCERNAIELESLIKNKLLNSNGTISRKSWLRFQHKLKKQGNDLRSFKADVREATNYMTFRSVLSLNTRFQGFQALLIDLASRPSGSAPEQQVQGSRTGSKSDHAPRLHSTIGPSFKRDQSTEEAKLLLQQRTVLHVAPIIGKGCSQAFCSCVCHKRKSVKYRLLDRILGSLMIGYEALPLLTGVCDVEGCKRKAPYFGISWSFPLWYSNQTVFARVYKTTSMGMEGSIRVRFKRPWGAPILIALEDGNVGVLRTLLYSRKAFVNDCNPYGRSLLSHALRQRAASSDIIETLLFAGADPYAEDEDGMTPILYVWRASLASATPRRLLPSALERGFDWIDLDLSNPSIWALSIKADKDFESTLSRISRSDVDRRDRFGMTALMWAARRGHTQLLHHLLLMGANPSLLDYGGYNVVYYSIVAGFDLDSGVFEQSLRLLHQSNADFSRVTRQGRSALLIACQRALRNDDLELCLELCGGNIDIRNENMATPLIGALRSPLPMDRVDRVVRWLLEHEADLEAKNHHGRRAIDYAIMYNTHLVLSTILKKYAEERKVHLCLVTVRRWYLTDYADVRTLQILRSADLEWTMMEGNMWNHNDVLEMVKYRRDHNNEWAAEGGKFPDEDPEAWYAAFIDLFDEIWEQDALKAAAMITNGDLTIIKDDDDTSETMPGTFPVD